MSSRKKLRIDNLLIWHILLFSPTLKCQEWDETEDVDGDEGDQGPEVDADYMPGSSASHTC